MKSKFTRRRFACVFAVLCTLMAFTQAKAQSSSSTNTTTPVAYAVADGTTLTFHYDDQYETYNANPDVEAYLTTDRRYSDDMAWKSSDITTVTFEPEFANYRPTSLAHWFSGLPNITTINNIQYLNTENVTNMYAMFSGCSKLESVDVSHFVTSKVDNFRFMFDGCSNLTSLDLSKFDFSKATTASCMFDGCHNLVNANFPKTVEMPLMSDMDEMFRNCWKLTAVPKFITSTKLTHMIQTFGWCYSLTELDVTGFVTDNVTDMWSTFDGCSGITELDVSHFNTKKVKSFLATFSGCSKLKELDVSHFDTSSAETMGYMFAGCSNLTELDVSNFNTSNVVGMSYMFSGCSGLTSLDLKNFDTSKVYGMNEMFYKCSALTTLDLSNFNTDNVTSMQSMFEYCSNLKYLDVSQFNTENVTAADGTSRIFNWVGQPNTHPCILVRSDALLNNEKITETISEQKGFGLSNISGGQFLAYLINDQTQDYRSPYFTEFNDSTVDVHTNRTLKAGTLNTFCAPFDIPRDTLEKLCGSDVRVKALSATSSAYEEGKSLDVHFADYTGDLKAGTPYIIEVSSDMTSALTFTGMKINATADNPVSFTYTDAAGNALGTMTFRGGSFKADVSKYNDTKNALFFKSGTLYYPHVAEGKPCVVYGMRAYFTIEPSAASSAKPAAFRFVMDETPTGIASVKREANGESAPAYTTDGQRVGSGYKGIVIKNGRKLIQK